MNLGGDTLSTASAQFGLRFLSLLTAQSPGKNVIVSPIGLFQALSLYGFLADESARRDLRKALHTNAINDDALHPMYQRMGQRLAGAHSDDFELICATALWLGSHLALAPALEDLAERWGVAVFAGNDVNAEAIAQWAHEKTRGLISLRLQSPPPNYANISNAVYFRGAWESRFDADNTQDRLFYQSGHAPVLAALMRQPETKAVRLYRNAHFDAARIPYVAGLAHEVALHVFLPRRTALNALMAKDDVTPLISQFTLTQWEACQSGYEAATVDLILPRFTFRQTHELEKTLYRMGFSRAFAPEPSTQTAALVPALQKVVQQTYMAVDEKGTTAAALTEMVAMGASLFSPPPPRPRIEKFYANCPFLFLLIEEMSGIILFAGVIHNPLAAN